MYPECRRVSQSVTEIEISAQYFSAAVSIRRKVLKNQTSAKFCDILRHSATLCDTLRFNGNQA